MVTQDLLKCILLGKYILLGADFLTTNLGILLCQYSDQVARFQTKTIPKLLEIRNVHDTISNHDTIAKFEPIFQTEISQMTLCTAGKHTIETGDTQPVAQANFRISVNYEEAINQEINKNLNLGIIKPSKSP